MKTIVITSINHPTEQVESWARLSDFNVVVVGDNKSPDNYHCEGVHFLNMEDQKRLYPDLARVLPENHYCRKLMGYLYAANELKSTVIIDTDDDNAPLDDWNDGLSLDYQQVESEKGEWINIYKHYSEINVWPRGYPVHFNKSFNGIISEESMKVDLSQGLCHGDPDVDAIFRLNHHITDVKFKKATPLVLSKHSAFSPTNSQNTTFVSRIFPLLYLPSTVTFRYTDILRGYLILALKSRWDINIGFRSADVFQDRNEHNLISDLNSEIPMYNDAETIVSDMIEHLESLPRKASISEDMIELYRFLNRKNVVQTSELKTLMEWLNAIC
jgi:hypothetical protein